MRKERQEFMLRAVILSKRGFSLSHLEEMISFFRNTFNQNVPIEKQETFIRVSSLLFIEKYDKKVLYFDQAVAKKSTAIYMIADASFARIDLSKFAVNSDELLSKSPLVFTLHCEGPNGFILEVNFERCCDSDQVKHIFIESDNPDVSRIFSEVLERYIDAHKGFKMIIDPSFFKTSLMLVREQTDRALIKDPLPKARRYLQL